MPCLVVEDGDDLTALWIPPETRWLAYCDNAGMPQKLPWRPGKLQELSWWPPGLLLLLPARKPYSVRVRRNRDLSFRDWYINLEQPVRRSGKFFDTCDLQLDVIVAPDRKSFHWKDEDELELAVSEGFQTREAADALRASADVALTDALSGSFPFEDRWAAWQPDLSVDLPSLPEGAQNIAQ